MVGMAPTLWPSVPWHEKQVLASTTDDAMSARALPAPAICNEKAVATAAAIRLVGNLT